MSYKTTFTALAWTDARTAALYFDWVLPVLPTDASGVDAEDPVFYEVLRNLLPQTLLESGHASGIADPVRRYVAAFLKAFPETLGVISLGGGEPMATRANSRRLEVLRAFGALVASSGVDDFAVYGEPLSALPQTTDSDPCLVLSNLNLVDTAALTWRQILEIRKDRESVEQLRNLRRAVFKDYSGRPESYIREDLEARISEYETVTKLWNLPLKKGVLEIAMTGEALTAAGTVLALTLFGAPVEAAAAAGGAIVVGKAALAFALRKREIELERRRNPMAYLVKLRNECGKN